MEDNTIRILFTLIGLYAGILTWIGKTGWNDIQSLKKELADMRTNCAKCQANTLEAIRNLIDERFDKMEDLLERQVAEKIEQGFTKIELSWVNDGRISPKRKKTEVS